MEISFLWRISHGVLWLQRFHADIHLLYCPLSYERVQDNRLLDIELYSEEFRAEMKVDEPANSLQVCLDSGAKKVLCRYHPQPTSPEFLPS